jgi:uncharacterized DUF497 family protein
MRLRLWYFSQVDFEWDPTKAEVNLRKHGITFDFATNVFHDDRRIEYPDPGDYGGEDRWIAVGRAGEFVLVVVFTLRGASVRIISARRGDRHEYLGYWAGEIQV